MSTHIKILSIVCFLGASASGQLLPTDWLRKRIEAKIEAKTVEMNANRGVRQKEAPAGDARSTSLVDQSASSDFVSAALALVPIGTGIGSPSSTPGAGSGGSGVVTASFYSLLALANKKDLTDPEFYKSHVASRQLSFSLGAAASDQVKDNTDKAGTYVGLK